MKEVKEVTYEEMAKEFANTGYALGCTKSPFEAAKEGFLAGLKIGREIKWHDLKKDSSDLPEPYATVLDEDGNKITYQGGGEWTFYSDYYGMDIEAIRPVAWCEIPTFKV